MSNLTQSLAELDQLHQSGALSDAEFTQAKARLLSGEVAPSSSAGFAITSLVLGLIALAGSLTLLKHSRQAVEAAAGVPAAGIIAAIFGGIVLSKGLPGKQMAGWGMVAAAVGTVVAVVIATSRGYWG